LLTSNGVAASSLIMLFSDINWGDKIGFGFRLKNWQQDFFALT